MKEILIMAFGKTKRVCDNFIIYSSSSGYAVIPGSHAWLSIS